MRITWLNNSNKSISCRNHNQILLCLIVFIVYNTCMLRVCAMSTSTGNKSRQRLVLHWFRHGDLRIHDNPALMHSSLLASGPIGGDNCCVVPIFCFDKKIFGDNIRTPLSDSLKCGSKRAKFITEAVQDLRQILQTCLDTQLVVAHGEPEIVFTDILTKLKSECNADVVSIVCQDEVVKEEKDTVKAVRDVFKKQYPQGKLHTVWGSTMYDLKDLPFNTETLSDMSDVFTPFRNKIEKKSTIQKPLPIPAKNKIKFPAIDSPEYKVFKEMTTLLPTLQELGYTDEQIKFANTDDPRGVMKFIGGETAGLARVKDYIWDKDLLKVYFETRNGMIGADFSTKFSPWLAHGCISPRYIASECKRYEVERIANKSTYWVVFELLWRDFCKFFALKHGDKIFYPGGTINSDKKWTHFEKNFNAWKEGKTGYPLVDANMREMKATGFMSNRGRQNVASFLAIDLAHDWRFGGDWFESNLLDYDVYSNWVNWCSAAGMTGGRLNRFNIVKQSKDYDQHGDYVRLWLPELKDVPNQFVHEPWKMTQFDQTQYNCRLGVDYPNPIVRPSGPPNNSNGGRGGGGKNQNKGGDKRRKPNNSNRNRHQKYEMKSLKQGSININ